MAKRKSGRNVHGILLLDKRVGVSSNHALQEIRRLYNANKAGHTGSLDPLATGLLPICLGEATKVSALLLDQDKRYRAVIKLGVKTDTGDAEGQVIQQLPVPVLTEQTILACLNAFVGEIAQVPPMYSALKRNGKKLYELARNGETVDRLPRNIRIDELLLLSFAVDEITLEVSCSKGTYIRVLAEEIAEKLGTCGSLTALRRLGVGCFDIKDAYSQEQLSAMSLSELADCLMAVDLPLSNIPRLEVSLEQAEFIKQGQQVALPISLNGTVRIYSSQGFLGLGEMLLNGKLAPKKLFNLEMSPVCIP